MQDCMYCIIVEVHIDPPPPLPLPNTQNSPLPKIHTFSSRSYSTMGPTSRIHSRFLHKTYLPHTPIFTITHPLNYQSHTHLLSHSYVS